MKKTGKNRETSYLTGNSSMTNPVNEPAVLSINKIVVPIGGNDALLTREHVIGAYKLFLGRDPENEQVIKEKLKVQSLKALIDEFVCSTEFKIKWQDREVKNLLSKNCTIDIAQAKLMLRISEELQRDGKNEPTLETVTSQLCTASQFKSPLYNKWCAEFREAPKLHRKQWEFVYILHALFLHGMLSSGKSGLGFGCGKEPLPAVMARYGCKVLATDQDEGSAVEQGWTVSNQHSGKLDDLIHTDICPRELFLKNVSYRNIDMNKISPDLGQHDFIWSSCAFEHLGSIQKGLEFVLNSSRLLKPGGVGIHTTEFNLSSNKDTFESDTLVFFRKVDIEKLLIRLETEGYEVAPLNLYVGERLEEDFIDLPPYTSDIHLKLALFGYLVTSLGIIVRKP
ncbi:MAG: class I SAM-dependent methyltransferase [Nitrospiria bacterium]